MESADRPAHADSSTAEEGARIALDMLLNPIRPGCKTCREVGQPDHRRYYCPGCGLVQCGHRRWSGGLYVRQHLRAEVVEGTVRHAFDMVWCKGGAVGPTDVAP